MKVHVQKILVLLARSGKSKKDLADSAGLSRQTITTVFRYGKCKPETAGKLATALKVDVTEIIE